MRGLDIASEPEVRQLVLLDAPSVLGWAGFREISLRYGLGMTEQLLTAAIDAGELKPQPTRPLATVMIGALDEAAMSIANADDPEQEKSDVRNVIHNLIDGLLSDPDRAASTQRLIGTRPTVTQGDKRLVKRSPLRRRRRLQASAGRSLADPVGVRGSRRCPRCVFGVTSITMRPSCRTRRTEECVALADRQEWRAVKPTGPDGRRRSSATGPAACAAPPRSWGRSETWTSTHGTSRLVDSPGTSGSRSCHLPRPVSAAEPA